MEDLIERIVAHGVKQRIPGREHELRKDRPECFRLKTPLAWHFIPNHIVGNELIPWAPIQPLARNGSVGAQALTPDQR